MQVRSSNSGHNFFLCMFYWNLLKLKFSKQRVTYISKIKLSYSQNKYNTQVSNTFPSFKRRCILLYLIIQPKASRWWDWPYTAPSLHREYKYKGMVTYNQGDSWKVNKMVVWIDAFEACNMQKHYYHFDLEFENFYLSVS